MKRKPINSQPMIKGAENIDFADEFNDMLQKYTGYKFDNINVVQMPPEPVKKEPKYESCAQVEDELLDQGVYNIPNMNDEKIVKKLVKDPICPIFYDSTGNLICVPSPHDVAIRDLHDNINGYSVVNPFLNKDNDSREVTNNTIIESIRNVTLNAYKDQLKNAIIGFLTENIGKNFTYNFTKYAMGDEFNPDSERKVEYNYRVVTGIKSLLYDILSNDQIYQYCLSEIVDCFIYQESTTNSFETKNSILFYNLCLRRDGIVSNIASALEEFTRHNIYNNNPAMIDKIRSYEYDEYMKQLNEESGQEITNQLFFFMQSSEYTSMLNSMVPMIDAIMWKMVNTLDYLMNEDIKKQIKGTM